MTTRDELRAEKALQGLDFPASSSSITRPNARPLQRRFKLCGLCRIDSSRTRMMSSRRCRRSPKATHLEECTDEVGLSTDEVTEDSESEEGA